MEQPTDLHFIEMDRSLTKTLLNNFEILTIKIYSLMFDMVLIMPMKPFMAKNPS